jgi:hypothetical protein
MQIDLAANDVELQRKRISKTMLELDKWYLNTTKRELLHEIKETYKTTADPYSLGKRAKIAKEKYEHLNKFINDQEFLELQSVIRDLELIQKLYNAINNKKKINKKMLNWMFVISSSIILVLTGIAIWVTMI